MKRALRFLYVLLVVIMCVPSIHFPQVVRAASGADAEPTYYYNNNYDAEGALESVAFNKVTQALVTGEDGNGYVQLKLETAGSHGTMTSALTGVESGSMLIEVDLATTEAGMPKSYFRILEKDKSASYELFFIQGDSIYATKNDLNNQTNAIATIPTDGTFTKFGVALTADITGTIVSADIYQYDAETGTWEYIGTNNGTGTNDPVGKTLSGPTNVSIQVRSDATTDQILLLDNLKVYSNPVYYYNNDYDADDALSSGVEFGKISKELCTDDSGNGYLQLKRGTADDGTVTTGNMTAALTGAESGSMLIEVDLATTTEGMPQSYFRIKDTNASGSYELFYMYGSSVYIDKNAVQSNDVSKAIATIPTDGTFTKFGVALAIDSEGKITSVDVYKYDEETGSWGESIGNSTNSKTIGQTLSNPQNVNIQIKDGESTSETLLIDNLKVYRLSPEFYVKTSVQKMPADAYDTSLIEVWPTEDKHPRVIFTEEDIPSIKVNLTHAENADAYASFNELKAKDYTGVLGAIPANATSNYDETGIGIIEAKAFDYVINRNDSDAEIAAAAVKNGEEALVAIKNYLATYTTTSVGSDFYSSGQLLFTAAEVYDWCYDLMDKDDRETIVSLCQVLSEEGMEIGFPPSGQRAVAGHGSGSQLLRDWMALAIATYDEYPDIYEFVAGRFYEEYVPARDYWFTSDTQHQGSWYGPRRYVMDLWAELLLVNMNGVDSDGNAANIEYVYEDASEVAYQWVYTRRPDGELLREGDEGGERSGDITRWTMNTGPVNFLASNLYEDGLLKKLFLQNANITTGYDHVSAVQMLAINNPSVIENETDAVSLSELPLTKYFDSPTGAMVARTGWNMGVDSSDVLAYMKISELRVANHQHKDAGSFQIYYKGILASDSGAYMNYDEDHDKYYYKSSIAHNTLSITSEANPTGVQLSPRREQSTIDDILANEDYVTGTVIGQEFGPDTYTPEYTYIAGDIAEAYTNIGTDTDYVAVDDNVTEAVRSMLFMPLDNEDYPAAFVVFDRITTQEVNSKKAFMLHMQSEPTIEGNVTTITNTEDDYNGMLTNQTLLPKDASITAIGGEGQQFMVGDTNYAPSDRYGLDSFEEGWGRVEVSTTTSAANQTDYLLNVMYVNDADETLELEEAVLIEADDVVGAKIFDRVAMFNKGLTSEETRISDNITFEIPADADVDSYKVNVAGIQAGKWTVTTSDNQTQTVVATEEGGIVYFTAPAGTCTLSRIGVATEEDEANKFTSNEPVVEDAGIDIMVNGYYLHTSVEPEMNGTEVMLPVKTLLEALGAIVEEGEKVTITYKDTTIVVEEGSAIATSGGNTMASTTTVVKKDGEFLVPFSFVESATSDEYAKMEWKSYCMLVDIDAVLAYDWSGTYENAIPVQMAYQFDNTEGEGAIWNALDGTTSTYWAAESDDGSVTGKFYFGQVYKLEEILLAFHNGHVNDWIFAVEVSEDGDNYTEIIPQTTHKEKTLDLVSYDIEDVKARYVRIRGYGYIKNGSAGAWNSISEIVFLGEAVPTDGEGSTTENIDIQVENMGSANSGVTVTTPADGWVEGENTFTVTGESACVVLISNDSGTTYTRLTATETEMENCYSFTAKSVTADTQIAVALAGDVNGDGKVNAADVTRLSAACLDKVTLDVVAAVLGDTNGDDKMNAADVTRLRAVCLDKTSFNW